MRTFFERMDFAIKNGGGYDEVADKTGIPKTTLRDYGSGKTEPKASKLVTISMNTGVSPQWLLLGIGDIQTGTKFCKLPMYDLRLSAGPGSFIERASVINTIPFDQVYLSYIAGDDYPEKHLSVFECAGNSMEPTINAKDLVVVDKRKVDVVDGIYAFMYGNDARIKTLQKTLDGLKIVSDNKELYDAEYVTGEQLNDIQIIGKVILRMGPV